MPLQRSHGPRRGDLGPSPGELSARKARRCSGVCGPRPDGVDALTGSQTSVLRLPQPHAVHGCRWVGHGVRRRTPYAFRPPPPRRQPPAGRGRRGGRPLRVRGLQRQGGRHRRLLHRGWNVAHVRGDDIGAVRSKPIPICRWVSWTTKRTRRRGWRRSASAAIRSRRSINHRITGTTSATTEMMSA